jgi:hypothetical protein
MSEKRMTRDEFMSIETGDVAGLEMAWIAYERYWMERQRDEAVRLLTNVMMGLDDYWITTTDGTNLVAEVRAFLAHLEGK